MTPWEIQSLLRPGDCLLYRGQKRSVFDWLIDMKTWHNITHCEMYVGNGKSVASRNGKGVAVYPWRDTELAYILRPQATLQWPQFWAWYRTVDGQGYDWRGLLRFAWFGGLGTSDRHKQFCSELLCRAYRVLAPPVIGIIDDADAFAPFQFLTLGGFTPIATPLSLK